MDNKAISELFKDAYNVFWTKHRDAIPERHSDVWDSIVAEGEELINKYHGCPLACDLVGALIAELDQRMRGSERDGG